MPTISTIDDVSNIRSIAAAVTANAGAIAIQNVAGVLKQVDDQGNVTSLGGGGSSAVGFAKWVSDQAAFVSAKVPALTEFAAQKVAFRSSNVVNSVAFTDSFTVEGGAYGADSGSIFTFLTGGICQSPKTGKWALAARVKLAIPTNGRAHGFGLANQAQTHDIDFSAVFSSSATKWLLETNLASQLTTVNADGSIHNVAFVADGTNVKVYVDGVDSGASLVQATAFSTDEPLALFCFNSTTGDVQILQYGYGYIPPT